MHGNIPFDRVGACKAKILQLLHGLPPERQSKRQLAIELGLKSSGHLTCLLRDDHLTPTLERAMVQLGYLPPRADPVLTEPCKDCGEVHAREWCSHIYGERPRPASTIEQRAQRIRRPRFNVAADNPQMALRQLEKYYPGLFTLRKSNE